MENAPEIGVVRNEFDRIGGNYAPEDSHVSRQNNLTGLTPPSYEQFDDQNTLGFEEDDLFGSFSMDEERTNAVNDIDLYFRSGNMDDLFASAPKCPEDYVEPPVAKRQKFNSASTTTSSSSGSTSQESDSPITESLSVFSQQAMPTRKTAEPSLSSNTTPKVTSEISQPVSGQESALSKTSSSGSNNSSNTDLPITPFDDRVRNLQTRPVINPASPLNNHSSQSFTNAIITPGILQTPSAATHQLYVPNSHQMVQQQPSGVTGIPLGVIPQVPQMQVTSNVNHHQLSHQQPRTQRRSFTEFLPEQNLGNTPFRRPINQQPMSVPATQQSTEQATSLHLPSHPTSNTSINQSLPQVLDRNSITPQLRETMERFETKIRVDEGLRHAFNIVFPGRSIEVEELKQKILNERNQATIRENDLKKLIRQYQVNASTQDALQIRAVGVPTTLGTSPGGDRSWLCLNYHKDGRLCNHIQQEFYLSKKIWTRRERCGKCRAKTHERNRKYFENEAAVAAWRFENAAPAMPDTPNSLKRTRDMADKTAETPVCDDSTRRKSLPTLDVAGQVFQQSASSSSRWASVPLPPQKKARNHAPLYNPKATQEALRAALGAPVKAWMQEPKKIETIVLEDDDDEEVEKDDSQGSSDNNPAVEPATSSDDADFEAELEADLTAALEAELA
ncbi:hypothetical protein SBOR_9347 [Sclerotinia borealis F-4128]|uniref:Uncharacterized protein n=1 Tax=Sclerotinia borealis (strain F-4128) TaxID=1432307 RepID=W9C2Z3_SCLBF|nr:hypothetical protein SBOR_9347 [Sclerotinia borealis F-4128]